MEYLGLWLELYLNQPVSAKGEVMRSTVLGDVLLTFALTATVDQLQHLVADQLEGVAVRPPGAVIVPAGLGCSVNTGMVDGVALGADVLVVVDVALLLGAVPAVTTGQEAIERCQQQG